MTFTGEFDCPCCGHSTGMHLLGQKESKLVCQDHNYQYVNRPFALDAYASNIQTYGMTMDTERVPCPCEMWIGSDEFQVFHERHLAYCKDSLWYRLMEQCRTEL